MFLPYEIKLTESAVSEDKDKEDQDKLGPLRPMLAPSKSAPSVPAIARDLKDRAPGLLALRSSSDSGGKSMPKSASASLLSLSMPSSPATFFTASPLTSPVVQLQECEYL